jgi:hypothetical protein
MNEIMVAQYACQAWEKRAPGQRNPRAALPNLPGLCRRFAPPPPVRQQAQRDERFDRPHGHRVDDEGKGGQDEILRRTISYCRFASISAIF